MHFRCLLFVLVCAATPLKAQAVPARPDSTPADTSAAPTGISPRGAFLRSLVVPGWGQSLVGAPARGAAYFALESVSLWMTLRADRRLADARAQQAFLRQTGVLAADQRMGLVGAREQQREDWITLSIFWLFFSGADAFVAAHLRDFNEHVGVRASAEGTLRIDATVPLRRRQ